MSYGKFLNIARLMTTYNLEIDIEVLPDNLKCAKCKLVLKDACSVPCGCRFCRTCIDDCMASGSEFCPGGFDDCRDSPLSFFAVDYSTNRIISQLTVKCPQNGCVEKCGLAELEEHMRVCGRKSVACPFHELGCQQDKLAAEEMSVHFQQENSSHCEILIKMIADINREMELHKREIEMLKRSDESRKMENEMLKHELVLKDEKIISILDQMGHVENEIKSIKEEKADLVDHVRVLSEKINLQIDERRESDERDMANVIEHIDREITPITEVIGSNMDKLDMIITSFKDDIRLINQEKIKSIQNDIDYIKSQVQSIQALAELGKIDASFEWTIDKDVDKTSWLSTDSESEYFIGTMHPYKYRLASGNTTKSEFRIYLEIYHGASDTQLAWPFLGRVAVTVADRTNCEVCESVTLRCEIKKPSYNQYSYSAAFKFSHSSLIKAGLDLARGVHVLCAIVPFGTV